MINIAFTVGVRGYEGLGLRLGYTSSTQTWEYKPIIKDDISRRSGINIGIFVQLTDKQNVNIITGLDYIQKGMGYSIDRAYSTEKIKRYSLYHYLSIPLLCKYKIPREIASTYFILGPRISCFLGFEDDTSHMNWGIEGDWNKYIFELCMGVGLEKKVLSDKEIFVDVMYYYEPFWQYDEYSPIACTDIKVKNSAFSISIGISY